MQEQLFAMSYIGFMVAVFLVMYIWYQKGRIDWAKKDIERLQKEVSDLQDSTYKNNAAREMLPQRFRELDGEIASLRQQLRGKEDEKLKESAQRFFDKDTDQRLTRMEKSLRGIEEWHREERSRQIDESLDSTEKLIDEINRKRKKPPKPPDEGAAN